MLKSVDSGFGGRVRIPIFDPANPDREMMSIDETADIEQARRWFAEELRHTAHVRSPAVVDAFATVPREHFAGPGPWRVLSPLGGPDYWTTDDADPRRLCHDLLVAIDETRGLNNGQPSLWAALFDRLGLATGERVIHVGAGLGYYSAILAEIVGPSGEVTAIEIDAGLAERARANLARSWPQAKVIATDGFALQADESVDAIVVNGVTHLALPWLDSLKADGGRLLVPLTNAHLWGAFLIVTREGSRYPVRFASRVGIIACTGGRDAEAEARLTAALARADYTAVKSLRRPPEKPDDTCWLAGDGWWLSTAPAGNVPGDL
jgi:protein-L-isoaspartate(D-aspartate) O-methyltransferase